jgi:hypothetical protein
MTDYIDKIDPNATIMCSYSRTLKYKCNYKMLIEEIMKTTHQQGPQRILSEELFINGLKCKIHYNSGHYTGYVIDSVIDNISEEDIDYYPHGGFTAGWGFDCMHGGDLSLNPMFNLTTTFSIEMLQLPFPLNPQKVCLVTMQLSKL